MKRDGGERRRWSGNITRGNKLLISFNPILSLGVIDSSSWSDERREKCIIKIYFKRRADCIKDLSPIFTGTITPTDIDKWLFVIRIYVRSRFRTCLRVDIIMFFSIISITRVKIFLLIARMVKFWKCGKQKNLLSYLQN